MEKTNDNNFLQKILTIDFFGIPMALFIFGSFVLIAGIVTNSLPTDIVGSIFLVFTFGVVLGKIGDNIPIWKDYLGGGAIFAFLVTSYSVYKGIIPQPYVKSVTELFDSGFLELYIAVTIGGSLLSIDRRFLGKTIKGFIPMVIITTSTVIIFTVAFGLLVGLTPTEVIVNYSLPIMGGGNGGGAIPLSQIWSQVTGKDPKIWYSSAIAVVTIANILAIVAAAILNGIGKKYPKYSGNGELIKGITSEKSKKGSFKASMKDGAAGLFIILSFYCLGTLFGKGILPNIGSVIIHPFAYMVIFVLIITSFGMVPNNIQAGAKQVQKFMVGNLFYVLIAGVGISMVDFAELIQSVNLITMMISIGAVFGAILGAWISAKWFGFYEIEAALAAGLCHINRGGSGDLEILGAAKRLDLMAYAQISTRLGGALILISAGFLFKILL